MGYGRVWQDDEYSVGDTSYTRKRGTQALKPNSQDVSFDYVLHSNQGSQKMVLIAKNFTLYSGGKIPGDVCLKVKGWLEHHRPKT